MFALDLFNTRYERDLREGAVDDLEGRRIDDLNAKMDDLIARARTAKTPEHKAGLKREFDRVKDERDSYFKIKEQQTPSNTPPAYKGIGDLQDPRQKMAQLQQKAKKGPLANVGAGLKAFLKGEPEPMDEEQVDKPNSGPRAFGVGNFQRLVKANMSNRPYVDLEFANSADNLKLDQAGLDLISDYYDGLETDQAKNHFIYRVLPSADEVKTILTKLGWNSAGQQQLPLAEKKKFNNSSDLEPGDVKVARELQKLRAQYPAAKSDLEAVAKAELDGTERSQQQLAAIKGANEKQDALLKQLVTLDQEQGRELDDLDQENNTLEKRLARVQATNDRLQQTVSQIAGTKKADSKPDQTKADTSNKNNQDDDEEDVEPAIDIIPNAPVDNPPTTTAKPKAAPKKVYRKRKEKPSPGLGNLAQQLVRGYPTVTPGNTKTDTAVKDKEVAQEPVEPEDDVVQRPGSLKSLRPKVATNADDFKLVAEHGGGIGPKQHWQDLMPEQSNTNDDDWYDDEPETELRSGDYVRDTQDGEYGEVFRMQGDPYERRVRILDRDGKGWYIEPGRLTRVDPQDPDVQRYFGKKRVRDMDEAIVASGPSQPLDDRAVRKLVWDTMKINADTGEQAIQRALAVLAKKPQSRMVQDLQDKFQSLADRLAQGVAEGWYDPKSFPGAKIGPHIAGPVPTPVPQVKDQIIKLLITSHKDLIDKYGQRDVNIVAQSEAAKAEPTPQGIKKAVNNVINFLTSGLSVNRLRQQTLEDTVGEGWSDAMVARRTGRPRTPYSVYIKGKKWKDFANDDLARAVMDKLKAKFKADGRDPETITIAPTDMTEAVKEPTTRQELLNRVDKIQRMMSQERNPANLQILRKELEMLKQRYQHLREDNDSEAVERAILNRIMVAHTDLLMKFGPEKVMQAAEEVAYNVGDVDEIGTSDVSAYVHQVKQILGVPEELDEKWSQKYKSSIDCASPKGFSQKAHCAGRKK
jgi:hypothetical protein